MSYTQIDNILGQPIPDYAINQLKIRSKKTLDKRDDQALVYTANKSAWIRVVSSVDISGSLPVDISTLKDSELAKNNVLFGGTSAYKKEGNMVSYEIKPYYSDAAIDPVYGFRPMPGITSAKISTQGRLGSILIAEIEFKANTKQQLDLVDILYFKIGYSMLIEWGNTFFYKQKVTDANNSLETDGTLYKSEDYSIDPFTDNPSKESIRIQIAKNIKDTHGNYCAMLGVVTNYSFSMNAEGGYDCRLKVMAPGMLGESMRVNGIPDLPKNLYKQAVEKLAKRLTEINKTNAELERERQRQTNNQSTEADRYPPCVKLRIDNKVFKTSTVGNETYAEAFDETKGFEGYGFFPSSSYFKIENSQKTTGTYKCVNTSIVDYYTDNVIGEALSTAKTFDELYDIAKNNSEPRTYQVVSTVNPYISNPDITDYFVTDKTREAGSKYKDFYLLSKYKRIIYLINKSVDEKLVLVTAPVENTTVKLNLGFNTQGAINYNLFGASGSNAAWDIILQGGKREIERLNNNYAFVNVPNEVFINSLSVTDYSDGTGVLGTNETTYLITYADGPRRFKSTQTIKITYSNKFSINETPKDIDIENKYVSKVIPGNIELANDEPNNRSKIVNAIAAYFNNATLSWKVQQLYYSREKTVLIATVTIKVEDLPAIIQYKETSKGKPEDEIKNIAQNVKLEVTITDLDLLQSLQTETSLAEEQAQSNETQQAPEQPLAYKTIEASELIKTEQSQYTSQLEAILRIVQLTTIGDTISDSGTINEVKRIDWTNSTYSGALYNGLFTAGAMYSQEGSVLKSIVSQFLPTQEQKKAYVKEGGLNSFDRYKMNLYYGFSRSLLKTDTVDIFKTLDKEEYRVDFKALLSSYIIPYYQSKNLIDGADIHYPTYIPLGFFFVMLNHCSFLYDTSKSGVNVPMFYLDFNPGTNVMLSSDFMLTANPYKFVVPFTGDLKSYTKLFKGINIKNDAIQSEGQSYPLWSSDAVSHKIPKFKYVDKTPNSGNSAYRGKIMNVLVSIDYLLDVIKRHSHIDETSSVYFRPMMEELLADLGKCLGNYNVFRLAYDDYSNCFYVVDDQTIPGEKTLQLRDDSRELPLFGRESIAKTLSISTEMSSKLGSMAYISANQDVKNQSTLGIDGTSIGALSLYAVDRYKRVTSAANQNSTATQNTGSSQREIAASRFNEAVTGFYYGGLRSENLVDQAVNYHIDAVARMRAVGEDNAIRSTTLLPLSVAFSTDGISSMAIYQSFTINEELLPYSYKYGMNQSETRRLGFIITGFEHTIQNNSWTTDVRANMYYIKRQGDYIARVGNQTNVDRFKDVPVALLQSGTGASAGSGLSASTYASAQAAKTAVLAANDEIEAIKIWTRATEGLSLYAIWDINNWRTGFGTEDITIAETGKNYKLPKDQNKWPIGINRQTGAFEFKDITGLVQKDGQQFSNGKIWHHYMSNLAKVEIITPKDAEADLERLVKLMIPSIKDTLQKRGVSWDSLSIQSKVAIFKVNYGYGNITASGKWIVDAYISGGQLEMARVAASKASVPGNSDYGADKLAILLS